MVSKFSDVALSNWEDDKLGFNDYAEGVIAVLESISKEDTPFTIGIFGSWGSGKTSFMQIMQGLLEFRGYQTIFFNSWEYGNEEKPWIPFMIKVVDELFENRLDKKELIKNIFLFSTDVVLQTYSQGMILADGILGATSTRSVLGKISTSGILDLIKKSKKTTPFKEWSDDDVNIIIERVTKIKEFKDKIEERTAKSPKRKIIIFIDDLDRIPEKLIDFLNSMKIFFDIKGCVFILGCDYKILDCALEQKYKGKIYEDYFDKIVQTQFYIPKISEQAIKEYLRFLTGWSDKEIGECEQLVIHSIGGNPRKIKRVVNATNLIKSVFERKLATFLQTFKFKSVKEKEDEMGKIARLFTPAKVFEILFERKVLFKLVCLREQWFDFYEQILIDEKKQADLFSLKIADTTSDNSELLSITKDKRKKLIETDDNVGNFLRDAPQFQAVEDIKTYLTLLEISSPEAGIFLEYAEPEKLSDNLFNRYLLFEYINKGKVDYTIIQEKIKKMDWESHLSSYHFFIEVISAFGFNNLIKNLFQDKRNVDYIAKKIRASEDTWTIGGILFRVMEIDEATARGLLAETKDAYVEKIKSSKDTWAIGGLLRSVKLIDEITAKELLNETKDSYAGKIRASSDPGAMGRLLISVKLIDEVIAKELLKETKATCVEKIRVSANPEAIGILL